MSNIINNLYSFTKNITKIRLSNLKFGKNQNIFDTKKILKISLYKYYLGIFSTVFFTLYLINR